MQYTGAPGEPYLFTRFFKSFAPVQFFVVKKIIFLHKPNYIKVCFAAHHSGAVAKSGLAAIIIILPIIYIKTPDAAISAGYIIHFGKTGILYYFGIIKI